MSSPPKLVAILTMSLITNSLATRLPRNNVVIASMHWVFSRKLLQALSLHRTMTSHEMCGMLHIIDCGQCSVYRTCTDYSYCVHKLCLLTLTSLAVESSEVSFSWSLTFSIEEVEMVILEGKEHHCCSYFTTGRGLSVCGN